MPAAIGAIAFHNKAAVYDPRVPDRGRMIIVETFEGPRPARPPPPIRIDTS